MNVTSGDSNNLWTSADNKRYELTNHLGNVLAVLSDARNSSLQAGVISMQDYYPFGSSMPGRYGQLDGNGVIGEDVGGSGYRYGFNGKENDNEVKGEGNQQDYGMRIYDPRLGRFLSVDPITAQYPELTPYQFASNRPIDGVDQDGLEWELSTTGERLKQQAQLKVDVADAPNRERAHAFEQAFMRANRGVTGASGTPQRYGYDQRVHEANRAEILNLSGLNADGSKQGWKKLAENKTFNNFANNLALPMVEMAVGEGVGRLTIQGAQRVKNALLPFQKAAKEEITVYRVFGGDARAEGFSWTTVNPTSVKNFRELAGLPSGGASGATNTADFMIKGQANINNIIKTRSALPLDGNKGGLPELIIDPKNVRLIEFKVLKP